MATSIAAALIGIFGASAIGGLGFIFTGLQTAIRDNSTRIGRLEEGFGRLEERTISEFGQIRDVLARIEATQARMEATQAEHGRQIEEQGRRIEEQGRRIEKLSGGDLP